MGFFCVIKGKLPIHLGIGPRCLASYGSIIEMNLINVMYNDAIYTVYPFVAEFNSFLWLGKWSSDAWYLTLFALYICCIWRSPDPTSLQIIHFAHLKTANTNLMFDRHGNIGNETIAVAVLFRKLINILIDATSVPRLTCMYKRVFIL